MLHTHNYMLHQRNLLYGLVRTLATDKHALCSEQKFQNTN